MWKRIKTKHNIWQTIAFPSPAYLLSKFCIKGGGGVFVAPSSSCSILVRLKDSHLLTILTPSSSCHTFLKLLI